MKTVIVSILRRIGVQPEKTWYALLALFNNLIVRSLEIFKDGDISPTNYRFVMIDSRNSLQEKFFIDMQAVVWRLDVTGLRHDGAVVASDQRSLNRGPLIIGADWTDSYNHRIVGAYEIAQEEDYRYDTHETVRMMVVDGAPWESTPEYASFRLQIESGARPYGLRNLSELNKRGEKILRLYDSLAKEGYKLSQDVGAPWWDEAHIYLYENGEICVGRHGNHRLAIARLLHIDRFPAIFGGVHLKFVLGMGVSLSGARDAVFGKLRDYIE